MLSMISNKSPIAWTYYIYSHTRAGQSARVANAVSLSACTFMFEAKIVDSFLAFRVSISISVICFDAVYALCKSLPATELPTTCPTNAANSKTFAIVSVVYVTNSLSKWNRHQTSCAAQKQLQLQQQQQRNPFNIL